MTRTTAVVGLLLVVSAHAVSAVSAHAVSIPAATLAQERTVESSMPLNIAGPLGIIVVALGLGGLLLGLWRLRRKATQARRAEAAAKAATAAAAVNLEPRTPAPIP